MSASHVSHLGGHTRRKSWSAGDKGNEFVAAANYFLQQFDAAVDALYTRLAQKALENENVKEYLEKVSDGNFSKNNSAPLFKSMYNYCINEKTQLLQNFNSSETETKGESVVTDELNFYKMLTKVGIFVPETEISVDLPKFTDEADLKTFKDAITAACQCLSGGDITYQASLADVNTTTTKYIQELEKTEDVSRHPGIYIDHQKTKENLGKIVFSIEKFPLHLLQPDGTFSAVYREILSQAISEKTLESQHLERVTRSKSYGQKGGI